MSVTKHYQAGAKFVNLFRKKEKPNRLAGFSPEDNGTDLPGEMLPAGAKAPEFSLQSSSGDEIALAELRGKPVILAFYPADWSPVCGDQLALYNEVLPMFITYNAQLLGISVDSRWSHQAYAQDRNLGFPLLADFEPKGAVAKKYGVYDFRAGVSERALFVVDAKGMIHWSYLSPGGVNPGADGILLALESLKT
jgi:peroxiredoxin